MANQTFFLTGTDTSVGKTVTTAVMALQLKAQGLSVGVFKPVQCAGDDARWLKKVLSLDDDIRTINPFYLSEPLSPHLAFQRARKAFRLKTVQAALAKLQDKYDMVLIEGAGGLLVPLAKDYTNANLAKDLHAPVIVVSRLGLGTINHTLLTVQAAQHQGLEVLGLVFSDARGGKKNIPQMTNPLEIARLSGVPVLGTIPFIKSLEALSLPDVQKRPFRQAFDGGALVIRKYFSKKRISGSPAKTSGEGMTKVLKRWDKRYIWHPFTAMKDWLADDQQPLIIERGQGVYLYATDGKRYIDGVSSLWVTVHGHNHPAINQAVKKQIDQISHTTFLGLSHAPAIHLAKELIALAPRGLTKVFYSDNGSTAVEIALKQAYQFWQNTGHPQKRTMVHLTKSYHGDTLGAVSVGGIDVFHKVYGGLIFKTHGLPGQGWEAVEAFETYLKRHASTTAALIVEPLVQGAAGMLVWPRGVLKRFRQLCTRYDVFLIADEVATGFGRTGTMFACQHEGVSPDFLCLAKGLSGGYLPLAATLCTSRVYEGFLFDYKDLKTFFHGHTYTANPLACAAALANLEVFKKERTLAKLAPKIKYLAKQLKPFYNLPSVEDIRQCGFMAGIALKGRLEDRVGAKVCQQARDYGVIIRPLGNVLVLMPPLSVSMDELDVLLDGVKKGVIG